LGGGLVKAAWFKRYREDELPAHFDRIVQSWETANKATELSDFSICTTWGVRDKKLCSSLNRPEMPVVAEHGDAVFFVSLWNASTAILVRFRRLRRPEAMTRAAGGNLLAVSVAAQAADEIKSGKWEFTTQMQLPGQSAPAGQAPGGNAPMTRTACIDAANPIPAEAQCKVDQVDRRGSLVTWAMTCNSPRGEIHSAGSARYAGNTMEGIVTAQVPGPNAQPIDTPGHIAGRYLAPCDAK